MEKINIQYISADMNQPRKTFENITDLIGSIIKYGLIEPLKVVKVENNKYKLIDGERRYRAIKRILEKEIGFDKKVNCIVLEDVDNDLILQLITDIHKEKLNPIEEAMAMKSLLNDGFSISELKGYLGKPREYITRRLKLLLFSKETQQKVIDKKIQSSVLQSIPIDSIKSKESEIVQRIENEGANISRAMEIVNDVENRETRKVNTFLGVISASKLVIENFRIFIRNMDKNNSLIDKVNLKSKIKEFEEEVSSTRRAIFSI